MSIIGLLLSIYRFSTKMDFNCNGKRERESESDTSSIEAKRFCPPLPDPAGFPEDPNGHIVHDGNWNIQRYIRDRKTRPSQINRLIEQGVVPTKILF